MKKTAKFMSMLLIGVCALGFTSCGDDDDDEGGNTPAEIAPRFYAISNTYVNDVVYPTYTALANDCQTLYTACQNLYAKKQAGTLTDADIKAACDAFKTAREQWERSEAFLYGAATDNDIDPHIDSWPLDQGQMLDAMTNADLLAGLHGSNPTQYVWSRNGDFDSTLGFHGLEFVLFRDGADRTAAKFNAEYDDFTDGENDFTKVKTLDEAAFASAVAGDLRNMTYLLAYGWLGTSNTDGQTFYNLLTGEASYVLNSYQYRGLNKNGEAYGASLLEGYYHTTSQGWGQTMYQILVAGCSNICSEVYQQKLGQAMRAYRSGGTSTHESEEGGQELDAIDYIESPYSHRSYIDYRDNIYSIRNTLYGTRDINAQPVSNSIMAYLQSNNSAMATQLTTVLNNAIAALTTANAQGSFVTDIAAGNLTNCQAAYDAVNALDDYVNEVADWFASQGNK